MIKKNHDGRLYQFVTFPTTLIIIENAQTPPNISITDLNFSKSIDFKTFSILCYKNIN